MRYVKINNNRGAFLSQKMNDNLCDIQPDMELQKVAVITYLTY